MSIKAIRTYDERLVEEFIRSPDIWATVAEDGQEPEDFKADVDSECWLAIFAGDDFIGLFNLHATNTVTTAIHAHVLPEFRRKYSVKAGRVALKWVIDNSDYQKIIAEIPVIYPNVKRFAQAFSFVMEGCNRKSYLKNGDIIDQWIYGITRHELIGVLGNE